MPTSMTTPRRVKRRSSTGSIFSCEGRSATTSSRRVARRSLCCLSASRVARVMATRCSSGPARTTASSPSSATADRTARSGPMDSATVVISWATSIRSVTSSAARSPAPTQRSPARPSSSIMTTLGPRLRCATRRRWRAPTIRQISVTSSSSRRSPRSASDSPFGLDVGDRRRERADLAYRHRPRGRDPRLREDQPHQGAVLDLRAERQRRRPGEPVAQPQHSQEPPPRRQARRCRGR